MARIRDKVRKCKLVKAYKVMEFKKGSKEPSSPYRGHKPKVGKWSEADHALFLSICGNGFHTLPSLEEAQKLCNLLHSAYSAPGDRMVVFECLISAPEMSREWAPFSTEEFGPWPTGEFVTDKQVSRYQKLVKIVYSTGVKHT